MPNIKISAAADAGTLLSSDMVPLARSGNTNAYHATMTEIATFTNASVAAGAYGNVGRNLLQNPCFIVAQRGIPGWSTSGYTVDRWYLVLVTDTSTLSRVAMTDTDRAQIGDEEARYTISTAVAGNAAAGAITMYFQRIEDVRRLSGKTITVSFWAKAGTGTLKVGVSIDPTFGSGGSPSPVIQGAGQSVTINTTWTRYSLTFAVPSSSGMTLGTNGDDCTQINIWYSAGATNATRSGNVGVQTGNIAIWGVQLEIGSVATPLDYGGSPADQLRQCQRFYQAGSVFSRGYNTTGVPIQTNYTFPVTMRAIPTATITFVGGSNVSGSPSAPNVTANAMSVATTVAASGDAYVTNTFTASADL